MTKQTERTAEEYAAKFWDISVRPGLIAAGASEDSFPTLRQQYVDYVVSNELGMQVVRSTVREHEASSR